MPRKPRAYRPKIKGCFECSKRRVSCDRTEPQCQKCTSSGLTCSGLGVRHRFCRGVATRGFWKGMTIQQVYEQQQDGRPKDRTNVRSPIPNNENQTSPRAALTGITPEADDKKSHQFQTGLVTATERKGHQFGMSISRDFMGSVTHNGTVLPRSRFLALQPAAIPLPSWMIYLLQHFSERVAVEMVAVDGRHNGWRHLLLPIAFKDQLVLNAVLAAAAFHWDAQTRPVDAKQGAVRCTPWPAPQISPGQLYTITIKDLGRNQSHLTIGDPSAKLHILLAILTLLVSVMVTGSEDFPALFRLLESALLAMGGLECLGDNELTTFIVQQVRKMRVYAAPLLSEQVGVVTISSKTSVIHGFECMKHCSQHRPEHSEAVSHVMSLVQQSYDIYLHQARLSNGAPSGTTGLCAYAGESIGRVQHFIDTFSSFPADSPGRPVLIWALFMAASDCVLEAHKEFFRGVLRTCHARSGFTNILRAMEHLESIWGRKEDGASWISLLPQAKLLIM